MNRYSHRTRLMFSFGIGFFAFTATFYAGAQSQGDHVGYVRGADWASTMHTNLDQLLSGDETADFTLDPWLVTAPMPSEQFEHTHLAVTEVTLSAEDFWTSGGAFADGVPYDLPAVDHASTYLLRKIHADDAITLDAQIGSDDGLQVWLNGEECWSHNAARVVGTDRDKVTLALHPGENHLLLKIYNRTGGHGFCFEVTSYVNPVWEQIARDFPRESAWFRDDLPGNNPAAWFSRDFPTEQLHQMLQTVLATVSAQSVFHESLKNLQQSGVGHRDPRWLTLYQQACHARELDTRLGSDRMAAVRRAVEDQAASFPDRYDGQGSLETLERYEGQVAGWRAASEAGQPPELAKVDEQDKQLDALLLTNPLLDFGGLLFIKRHASKLGLPQNWQGNCSVGAFGYDNEIDLLSPVQRDGHLTTLYRPEGGAFVGDIDLHFDGDRMLVSMPGTHDRWQIWELTSDGSSARQVTLGEYDDVDNYDACYLPDGGIIFDSTRCFQGIPCVSGSDQVANLFRMDADGTKVRQLCFDQDHNWCPTVMENGRVLFSRWEYSDTPHYFSRLLFHMNPDGTNQVAYYGSNSFWPNSIFYARPIPGKPTQFISIISGHHGVPRMGELILFDVSKGRFEADGVVQRIPGYGQRVEPVIADQLVDHSWPRFLHPYPLDDRYFLVSCKPTPHTEWGLYLADVFDNLVLIQEVPGYALFEPVPLRSTPKPPSVPDKVNLNRDTATVYIADLYTGEGLRGVPRGTVKRLRVSEFHYAYNRTGGHELIGMEGPWDVHRILGTVPVNEDGSVVFEVPANVPIALHPLDGEGKAVQLMRSWFTGMPGETVSCTGCHENQNSAPPLRRTIASTQSPAVLDPWYGPARGFSFKREVQPVLNRHCMGCHHGGTREDGRILPDFTEQPDRGWGGFTPSYLALHPYVRRPGPESDYHLLKPMEYHADTSPLVQMLEKGHGGVVMDAESWERIITWIDLNAPDHGTWHEQCTIPDPFARRRLAMRTTYAGRPEDPEHIPEALTPFADAGAPQTREPAPAPEAVSVSGWPMTEEQARSLQEGLGASTRKTVDLGEGITLDLVLVPAGTFVMGDREGPSDVQPPHMVTIETPFWMGTTEVTLAQFLRFFPAHDQGFIDQQNKDHTRPGYAIDQPDMPVVRVTQEEADQFCHRLTTLTGESFTLPTEAQWEWACRSGADTSMSFGAHSGTDFSAYANLADASLEAMAVQGIDPQPIPNPSPFQAFLPRQQDVNDGHMLLAPVGSYAPNYWGLYDMHGNAAEWTQSVYQPYPGASSTPASDTSYVVRGGSWSDHPKRSTAAYRLPYARWQPVYNVGFRVVCATTTDSQASPPLVGSTDVH